MAEKSDKEADQARIRARLADLDAERRQLYHEMASLEVRLTSENAPAVNQPTFENAPVTNASPSNEKVDLFRSLHRILTA